MVEAEGIHSGVHVASVNRLSPRDESSAVSAPAGDFGAVLRLFTPLNGCSARETRHFISNINYQMCISQLSVVRGGCRRPRHWETRRDLQHIQDGGKKKLIGARTLVDVPDNPHEKDMRSHVPKRAGEI